MQKILRRVATAERVAAKRSKLRDLRRYKKEKKENMQEMRSQLQEVQEGFDAAKQAVKDEWELGPLAPRRDVGNWAGAKGSIDQFRYNVIGKLSLVMRNRRCQWAGGAYNLNLVVDDRVVLIDGPDKGKIGKILSINEDKAEVVVRGLNKSNIRLNPNIRVETDPSVINIELPIPISAIRLVHPLKDPETGVTRDVIINKLVHVGIIEDRITGMKRWSRVVPGLNVAIPWPKKADPEFKDHSCDTLRIIVEEKTFVPTLLRPPMPEAIIDELRHKYSRFRTRHDPAYIARLEAEEQAKKDRSKLMISMRTPLQELHRAERENKKKKGKPRLTIGMLEKIGEVMARNMERTRNAKALLDAPSSSNSSSSGGGVSSSNTKQQPPPTTAGEPSLPPTPEPTETPPPSS
ncbi:hypothetical protein GGR54DRAFT_581413 [Hypoxylon sp. NC1633]|nr:hypothetical protein GGR54DRAFT_581413 [Hypoxylon sp. NC1633]